jgi:hypothetical protein
MRLAFGVDSGKQNLKHVASFNPWSLDRKKDTRRGNSLTVLPPACRTELYISSSLAWDLHHWLFWFSSIQTWTGATQLSQVSSL